VHRGIRRSTASRWTIREAAAIADLPAKMIRNVIDREGLQLGQHRHTPERHLFTLRDLMFLKLLGEFPFALSKQDKAALEELVRGRKPAASRWRVEGAALVFHSGSLTIQVNYGQLRERLARNAVAFHWGERRLAIEMGTQQIETVFRGTSTSLAQVSAAIRAGENDEELALRFPGLSQTDIDYSRIHARLGKRVGRPRKPMTMPNVAVAA